MAPTVREMRGIASRVRKGAKTAATAASKLSEYSGENGLRRKDDVTIGELQTALQTLMDAERFLRGLGIVTPTEESENR